MLLSVSEETGGAGNDRDGACFVSSASVGMEMLRADSVDAPIVSDAEAGAATAAVATGAA